MRTLKYLALLPVISLAACGGGGSNGSGTERDIPPVRPNAEVYGTGFDGLIIDGDVSVSGFSNAIKGELLSTTKTDSVGRYLASIQSPDTPILISIDGGFYVEEASGQQKQVDPVLRQKLIAVDYYESGSAIEVSATFFTTLATGLTEYLVQNQGLSTEVAIERAYAEIDAWAGFDTRRTTPLAVNDIANASPLLTNALKAGFVAAGISELTRVLGSNAGTEPHSTFYSIGFIQVAYEDIKADGILNGVGSGGDPLSYGTLLINSDTYRTLLSTRLLQFVSSDYNQTGLEFSDLVGYAGQLNLYAGELFNYSAAQDLSEIKPQITSTSPSEVETLKGTTTLSATVSDSFGIDTVEFLIDGMTVATLSQSPYIHELSTLSYQNGSHELEVIVTNLLGNTESRSRSLNVYNGTISFSASSSSISRVTINGTEYCPASIRVNDGIGLGVEYIKIDGVTRYNDESMPNGYLNVLTNHTLSESGTAYSNPRCPLHTIEVKDSLGNIYTSTYGLWWFGGAFGSSGSCYVDIGKCRY